MNEKEFDKKITEDEENRKKDLFSFTADSVSQEKNGGEDGFLEETDDATAFFDSIDRETVKKYKEKSSDAVSERPSDENKSRDFHSDDNGFTGKTMAVDELISDTHKTKIGDDTLYLNMETTVSDIVLPEEKKEEKFSFMSEFFDFVEMIVFSVLFVIFVFTFIGRNVVVDGDSMLNTLHENDILIITNLSQNFERGDIIVFLPENPQHSKDLDKPFIKRVIAVENDVIDIDDNHVVYINGEPIYEPYLRENMQNWNKGNQEYPFTVPENHLFVMGDNREVSWDSRSTAVGIVDRRTVMGKVVLRLFPFSGFGTVD